MAYSYHYIFTMIINTQVATPPKLIIQSHKSMTTLIKVPRILKQVKPHQVARQQTLKNHYPKQEHSENIRRREWRMEKEPNISLIKSLFNQERHHQQISIVHPNSL